MNAYKCDICQEFFTIGDSKRNAKQNPITGEEVNMIISKIRFASPVGSDSIGGDICPHCLGRFCLVIQNIRKEARING